MNEHKRLMFPWRPTHMKFCTYTFKYLATSVVWHGQARNWEKSWLLLASTAYSALTTCFDIFNAVLLWWRWIQSPHCVCLLGQSYVKEKHLRNGWRKTRITESEIRSLPGLWRQVSVYNNKTLRLGVYCYRCWKVWGTYIARDGFTEIWNHLTSFSPLQQLQVERGLKLVTLVLWPHHKVYIPLVNHNLCGNAKSICSCSEWSCI